MWTESRGRLPTYLLVGGSGPNVVHACSFFFFFLSEYKICLLGGQRILAHVFRDLGFLDLGSCFQRTKGFLGFGSCFERTKVLDPGSCFQRPRIFGSWLMFLEDQGFLDFGSCFQWTKGSGSWLMFSET